MTPTTTLTLGSFQFSGLEIPTQIGFGGSQSLAIHKLVGGERVIDAMGRDDRPLEWSGLFFGANAVDRARELDAMRIAGTPQTLLWNAFNYLVIVRDFSADFRRQYEIPYRLSCEVVSDNTTPITGPTTASIDDAMAQGLSAAQIQAEIIANEALSESIAALANVMDTIQTYWSIAASTAGLVASAIANAQTTVASLIGIAESTVSALPGFGGVVAGSDALSMALALDAALSATLEEAELWNLAGILGVMAQNLNSANGSPNTLAVVGGNLFQIAAAAYGDATTWGAIAQANGLVDPFITGPVVLTIPLSPTDSGGILSN